MKDKDIIKKLKQLKRTPVRREFLASLKSDLKEYMAYHPVRGEIKPPVKYSSFRIFRNTHVFKFVALILILVVVFGGGGVAWASQESLPGEALYQVKLLTEDVQEVLTLKPEDKAHLQTRLAQKRITEMEKLLEEKGVEAKGLEVAQVRLQLHAEKAVTIIKEEAKQGKEISKLAADVVDDFHIQREETRKIFEENKKGLKVKKGNLRQELLVAIEVGDIEKTKQIRGEISHLDIMKDKVEVRKNAAIQALEAEKYTLHSQLQPQKLLEVEVRNKAEALKDARVKALEAIDEVQDKAAEETEEALEEVRDILQKDLSIETDNRRKKNTKRDANIEFNKEIQSTDIEQEVIESVDEIIDLNFDDVGIEDFLNEMESLDTADFGI